MADYLQTTYGDAKELTKSDSAAVNCRALIVLTTGDIKITTAGGNVMKFVGLAAGVIIPIQTILVWSAGTTGTVAGLY